MRYPARFMQTTITPNVHVRPFADAVDPASPTAASSFTPVAVALGLAWATPLARRCTG
jgi:hypothetical protein